MGKATIDSSSEGYIVTIKFKSMADALTCIANFMDGGPSDAVPSPPPPEKSNGAGVTEVIRQIMKSGKKGAWTSSEIISALHCTEEFRQYPGNNVSSILTSMHKSGKVKRSGKGISPIRWELVQ